MIKGFTIAGAILGLIFGGLVILISDNFMGPLGRIVAGVLILSVFGTIGALVGRVIGWLISELTPSFHENKQSIGIVGESPGDIGMIKRRTCMDLLRRALFIGFLLECMMACLIPIGILLHDDLAHYGKFLHTPGRFVLKQVVTDIKASPLLNISLVFAVQWALCTGVMFALLSLEQRFKARNRG